MNRRIKAIGKQKALLQAEMEGGKLRGEESIFVPPAA
jgi:hypothetical protein